MIVFDHHGRRIRTHYNNPRYFRWQYKAYLLYCLAMNVNNKELVANVYNRRFGLSMTTRQVVRKFHQISGTEFGRWMEGERDQKKLRADALHVRLVLLEDEELQLCINQIQAARGAPTLLVADDRKVAKRPRSMESDGYEQCTMLSASSESYESRSSDSRGLSSQSD